MVYPSASSPQSCDTSTLCPTATPGFIPKLAYSQAPFWRKTNSSSKEKAKHGPGVGLLRTENPKVNHANSGSFWQGQQPCCSTLCVLSCLHMELSCLYLQVSRTALLWAVLFLALWTEEPHTHIKQTKNMPGPKKYSVSQRQGGAAPA